MTDLLGLLAGIHHLLAQDGVLHLAITQVEGMAGVVDLHTRTIHLAPGLSLPETLRALADAVAVLAPQTELIAEPIAVGGGDAGAVVPSPRHLSVVQTQPISTQ